MTREEHISNLETIGCDGWTVTTEAYKSLQFAIKVLKQEPTIDKIRAEIEQEYAKFRNKSDMWNERACGLGTALEIIDKYKAESEDKE